MAGKHNKKNSKPTKREGKYSIVSKELLKKAKEDMEIKGLSIRQAAKDHNIKRSTLHDYVSGTHPGKVGRKTALTAEEERIICERIKTLAEWGFPLDVLDVRMLVKAYLQRTGQEVKCFKDNMPGYTWGLNFCRRHKANLSLRITQNIKTARAKITPEILTSFYTNLKTTLDGVPPENIINYDESNLTDDPGKKKVLVKRGTKYPERVLNTTKSSISIMFSGTAAGHFFPPYVVYRSVHLYDTWTEGGPEGTRYNRTNSGWFESPTFDDWFHKIILPYAKKCSGKVVMIGDNLTSHLSPSVVKTCEDNNIAFTLLPPNSTHLTQPLDVAVFRPMKIHWRSILHNFKKTTVGRLRQALPKDCFPALLTELFEKMSGTIKANLKSGFRKCGIVPIDPQQPISRLPQDAPASTATASAAIDSSVMDMLKEMRHGNQTASKSPNPPPRKKRLSVTPGTSITSKNLRGEEQPSTSAESSNPDDPPPVSSADTTQELLPLRKKRLTVTPGTSITSKKLRSEEQPSTSAETSNPDNPPLVPSADTTQELPREEPEEDVSVSPANWVVVKVPIESSFGKEKHKYFVGVIVTVEPTIKVRFLKHVKGTCHTFINPDVDDFSDIEKSDIVRVLQEPSLDKKCRMIFDIDVNLWPK